MPSRTRGQKVKSDVSRKGLLNWIPTDGLISKNKQTIYYQLLSDLRFEQLPIIKQPLAILFAQKFCELLTLIDMRDVHNEADKTKKNAEKESIEKVYAVFLKLYNALQDGAQPVKKEQDGISNLLDLLNEQTSSE